MAEKEFAIRFTEDGEIKAFRNGVEIDWPERRTSPRPAPTYDFTCIVCERPREAFRHSGAGSTANLVCGSCAQFARGVGQTLRVTRGDRDVLRRLSSVTDAIFWECRRAHQR